MRASAPEPGILGRAHLRAASRLALAVTLPLLIACVLGVPAARAQPAEFTAVGVKAAYLYHFGTYVDWTESKSPEEPIRIGVAGAEPVTAELRRILPGRTIQDRRVVVRQLRKGDDPADFDLLYIGPEDSDRAPSLIKAVQQRPTLVVTDWEKGLEHGGIINFVLLDSRVRFEISLPAAERAGLKLSSRLLSAAVRVKRSYWHGPSNYVWSSGRRYPS
jgi:hypothetical protein